MNYFGIILTVCLLNTVFTQEVKKVRDCVWATSDLTLDLTDLYFFEYFNHNNPGTFRYYPCKVYSNWDPSVCTIGNNPALCQKYQGPTHLIGNQSQLVVTLVKPYTFELMYFGGNNNRKGIVTITCFQDDDVFYFDYEVFPIYHFSMSVKTACKTYGRVGEYQTDSRKEL
ncbi:hypothetical protein LOD99_5955 [Oopsacas minuta]|uniref:Uncharacterized protein n=1 Tax=Oopsacas minuta TaxID=111878 RepID=A0AAV7JPJ7_9METZ|nr:hypothetical protein LOD99_5955 [Oopsacas minuta]